MNNTIIQKMKYSKCPKISDKMAYANRADPDQTAAPESDQRLHCLPFY